MIGPILNSSGYTLAPHSEEARTRLRALRRRGDDLVVPAAVLAEGVLTGHPGRDHHVRKLLGLVSVIEVDGPLGHAAGALRVGAIRDGIDPPPSGVDAIVAATANAAAAGDEITVVTSDPGDIAALLAAGSHPDRVSILRV